MKPKRTRQQTIANFWANVSIRGPDDCWVWNKSTTNGYGKVWDNESGKLIRAHRFAYDLCLGDIGDLQVLHRCDNRPCCNPNHLFLGTDKNNSDDMTAKGRAAKGQEHYLSKLTNVDVLAILSDRRSNVSIAKSHDISASNVSRIKNRKIWKHIKTEEK